MKKTLSTLLAAALLSTPLLAQENAEALVASMRQAEMTYKELMQIMGSSINQMQLGVLSQNRELVERGANLIFTHPAPNHKPWAIVEPKEQEGFKQALLTYDKVLDADTNQILKASRAKDWLAATSAIAQLQTSCVSCHMQWKDKAQRWSAPAK